MSEPDAATIGAAWDRVTVAQQNRAASFAETHPDGWAIDWMMAKAHLDPEPVWDVVVWVVENTRSPWSITMIAAGEVETLLGFHGERFIDWIEDQARRSPRWRYMLTGVWPLGNEHTEVWARVVQARRDAPVLAEGDPQPPV